MKLFIFLLLLGNLSFAQELKIREIDGVVIVPENNPALIERKKTDSYNNSSTGLSQRELNQLMSDIYRNPLPSEATGKFGWSYNANGDGKFTFCSRAPEPSTNALMIIGLSSLLFFRRKLK